MEAFNNNNTYQQIYIAEEDDTLLSRIDTVICVLMQRSVFIAGFDADNEVLTINHAGYSTDKTVWDPNFFERLFANEPLLAAREKVKALFISTDKNIIVPDDLYEEKAAQNWLKHIHYIEDADVVSTQPISTDQAQFVYAIPAIITELIHMNFEKAAILPLPLYQFQNDNKQRLFLQCCISSEQVCATLHNYSQLLWHKVFTYTCAEDIAYEMQHQCVENNISPSDITIVCNAVSSAEYDMINDVSQYYAGIEAGDGTTIHYRWDPAISLAKQLLACV